MLVRVDLVYSYFYLFFVFQFDSYTDIAFSFSGFCAMLCIFISFYVVALSICCVIALFMPFTRNCLYLGVYLLYVNLGSTFGILSLDGQLGQFALQYNIFVSIFQMAIFFFVRVFVFWDICSNYFTHPMSCYFSRTFFCCSFFGHGVFVVYIYLSMLIIYLACKLSCFFSFLLFSLVIAEISVICQYICVRVLFQKFFGCQVYCFLYVLF